MKGIRGETARMGHLVEDLLLLARLDESRPIERAPVDLVEVAKDAVEAIKVTFVFHQRRAGQVVEILDPPAGEVFVHRLHQRDVFAQRHRDAGLLQLMKEGRKHSKCPGAGGDPSTTRMMRPLTQAGKKRLKIYLALHLLMSYLVIYRKIYRP